MTGGRKCCSLPPGGGAKSGPPNPIARFDGHFEGGKGEGREEKRHKEKIDGRKHPRNKILVTALHQNVILSCQSWEASATAWKASRYCALRCRRRYCRRYESLARGRTCIQARAGCVQSPGRCLSRTASSTNLVQHNNVQLHVLTQWRHHDLLRGGA